MAVELAWRVSETYGAIWCDERIASIILLLYVDSIGPQTS